MKPDLIEAVCAKYHEETVSLMTRAVVRFKAALSKEHEEDWAEHANLENFEAWWELYGPGIISNDETMEKMPTVVAGPAEPKIIDSGSRPLSSRGLIDEMADNNGTTQGDPYDKIDQALSAIGELIREVQEKHPEYSIDVVGHAVLKLIEYLLKKHKKDLVRHMNFENYEKHFRMNESRLILESQLVNREHRNPIIYRDLKEQVLAKHHERPRGLMTHAVVRFIKYARNLHERNLPKHANLENFEKWWEQKGPGVIRNYEPKQELPGDEINPNLILEVLAKYYHLPTALLTAAVARFKRHLLLDHKSDWADHANMVDFERWWKLYARGMISKFKRRTMKGSPTVVAGPAKPKVIDSGSESGSRIESIEYSDSNDGLLLTGTDEVEIFDGQFQTRILGSMTNHSFGGIDPRNRWI